MKTIKHTTLLPMAAALLMLAACSQDDYNGGETEQDAVAQPLTVTTRTTDGETATEVPFDSFYLYLCDPSTGKRTEEHTLTWDAAQSQWLENGQQPTSTHLPAIVNAVAGINPFQVVFDNGESIFVFCQVPTDQTDAAKLEEAGSPMFAVQSHLDKDTPLSLDFKHGCAKLVFNVNMNTEDFIYGDMTDIKVKAGIYSIYNSSNGGGWDDDEWKESFSCFYDKEAGTISVFTGLTSFAAGDVIMTLSVDGIPFSVKLKQDLKVVPGHIYSFDLTVTPKEAKVRVGRNSSMEDDDKDFYDWGTEENEREI